MTSRRLLRNKILVVGNKDASLIDFVKGSSFFLTFSSSIVEKLNLKTYYSGKPPFNYN